MAGVGGWKMLKGIYWGVGSEKSVEITKGGRHDFFSLI